MKVLFLVIATNNHNKYISSLIKSIKQYAFPQLTKDILLFSDKPNTAADIIKPIAHLPWPLITLLRFNYFKTIADIINLYDYVFYIDSDMEVVSCLREDILPPNNEIVATSHYHYSADETGPYEFDNKQSTAYVSSALDLKGKYCQACFFGSDSKTFLKMVNALEKNIRIDLEKNIIARWHDESHFNKFLLQNKIKQLDQGYCYNIHHDKGYKVNTKILHYENQTSTHL